MSNIIYIEEALEIFKQDPRVQAIIRSKVNPKIADDLGDSVEALEQQVLLETLEATPQVGYRYTEISSQYGRNT